MKLRKLETHSKTKAQAMLEFALTIPIVLVLVLGIIEGGFLLYVYSTLTAAGREAARYGASVGTIGSGSTTTPLYNDCAGIKAAAMRIGSIAGVTTNSIQITHEYKTVDNTVTPPVVTTNTEIYCTTPTDVAAHPYSQGDRIDVRIDVDYTPLSPLIYQVKIPLHTENWHSFVMDVGVLPVVSTSSAGGGTCDPSLYYTITQSDPLASNSSQNKDVITLTNTTATATSIVGILVKFDTSSGPTLESIDTFTGLTGLSTTTSAYISDPTAALTLPAKIGTTDGTVKFTLTFSKKLSSPTFVWLKLADDNKCGAGTWFGN